MVARAAEFEQPQPSPLTNAQINSMVREDLVPLCTNPEAIQRNAPKIGQLLATLTQPGVNLGDYQRGINRLLENPDVKEETAVWQISITRYVDPSSLQTNEAKNLLKSLNRNQTSKIDIESIINELILRSDMPEGDFRRINRLANKLLEDIRKAEEANNEQPQVIRVRGSAPIGRRLVLGGAVLGTLGAAAYIASEGKRAWDRAQLDKEAGVGREVYFPDITRKNVEFTVKSRAEIPGFVYITNNKGEEFEYPVPVNRLSFDPPKVPTSGQAFVDDGSTFSFQPAMITAYDERSGFIVLNRANQRRETHIARISDKPFKELKAGDYAYWVLGGKLDAYHFPFHLIKVKEVLDTGEMEYYIYNEEEQEFDPKVLKSVPDYIQRMPNLFTQQGWPKKKDA